MFFQLPEIERIQSRTHQLSKQKQQLQSTVTRAYTNKQKVQGSLNITIDSIIEKSSKNLKTITSIEQEAENGYLIPEQIDLQELIYDRAHLPEWFEFVFKKQFTKNKQNLDVIAKKLYKSQYLSEKRKQLEREIKMFEVLYGRYLALNQSESVHLNIMGEAQTLKNKSENIIDKFLNYLMLVSEKINQFVQENVEKALNYNNKTKPKSDKREVNYLMPEEVIMKRMERPVFTKNMYPQETYSKQTPTNHTMADFYPQYQPHIPTDIRIASNPYGNLHRYQPAQRYPHSHHPCPHNHQRPLKSGGFQNSRFNYRDHLPRWMNKTLSQYYF